MSSVKSSFTTLKVMDFGWPDFLAPPLENLCSICKSIDSWLSSDPQHVAVLHCKVNYSELHVAIVVCVVLKYDWQYLYIIDACIVRKGWSRNKCGSHFQWVCFVWLLLSRTLWFNSRGTYLLYVLGSTLRMLQYKYCQYYCSWTTTTAIWEYYFSVCQNCKEISSYLMLL